MVTTIHINHHSHINIIIISTVSFLVLFVLTHYIRFETSSIRHPDGVVASKIVKLHPAFEPITINYLQEYSAEIIIYRHRKTGAEILSVDWDRTHELTSESLFHSSRSGNDDEKVFGIHFRTPPADNTGLPHILEHAVLCGSKKYPIKDPFATLKRGSLQTFLNAMTFPDRTGFVFASRNNNDFNNMMGVYMDAVFHPVAVSDPWVLAQEGWHLDVEERDGKEELVYGGIVYNEMKGAYSDPDQLLARYIQTLLFPSNVYRFDSGGSPPEIPNLTFQKFVDFHTQFYHPSNAKIFVSGMTEIDKFLETLDDYLEGFSWAPSVKQASKIEWQKKNFKKKRRMKYAYPSPATDGGHVVAMAWLLNDKPMSVYDELVWVVLNYLLLGTPASIMNRGLMEANLGSSVVGGGFDNTLLQSTFTVGLRGVTSKSVEKVEQKIRSILGEVVQKGFAEDEIAAAINSIEFQLREFNTGSTPRGISFMLGIMQKWIYEEDPLDGVRFEDALAKLKEIVNQSESGVFKNAVKELLLNNGHCVRVELFPSSTLEAEVKKQERDNLSKIQSAMSQHAFQSIKNKAVELKRIQTTPDPPNVQAMIPTLTLNDLKRSPTEYHIHVEENAYSSGIALISHHVPSSAGIIYVDLGIDVSHIPYQYLPLLNILPDLMLKMGTKMMDRENLHKQIGRYTGGISMELLLLPKSRSDTSTATNIVLDNSSFITKLFIRGKSTAPNLKTLLYLFEIILKGTVTSQKNRMIEILSDRCSKLGLDISSQGSYYANTRLRAQHSLAGFFDEKTKGVTSLLDCRSIQDDVKNKFNSVEEDLNNLLKQIFDREQCRRGIVLNLTGNQGTLQSQRFSIRDFVHEQLPGDPQTSYEPLDYGPLEVHPWVHPAIQDQKTQFPIMDEGIVVPTQVNYVSQGGLLYQPGEIISGSTDVVSHLLETSFLWDTIRVQHGAYGAHSTLRPKEGYVSFVSYRDPHIIETLDVYDTIPNELVEIANQLKLHPVELAQAIIGTVGELDGAVLAPNDLGWVSLLRWLKGETKEMRQKWRDEVINTKADDFETFSDRLKYAKLSVEVVGSSGSFEEVRNAGRVFHLTTF